MSWEYRGILPAMQLPFEPNLRIDEPELRRLTNWLAGHKGIGGLVTNGHTGEVFALTAEQRADATRIVVDEANGRLPVISGICCESIFDAVKHAALIHQSGGGCISGDAHVFTTYCGVEAIETLYARVQEAGYAQEVRGDHAVIDVGDLNIRTMALNSTDGGYEPAQVTH